MNLRIKDITVIFRNKKGCKSHKDSQPLAYTETLTA